MDNTLEFSRSSYPSRAVPASPAHPTATASDIGRADLLSDKEAREATNSFGEYQLREEIGRGRIGIVYRAFHVGLKREVALKVIRVGRFASPEQRERFRLEAEAVAALNHPNIVPIYEVGESQGRPYFTMQLVESGNLAEHASHFADKPQAAARLLAVVARAVHHAHERGLVHRDLKPANVLLAWEDGPLAGPKAQGVPSDSCLDHCRPYLIDLGLAKRLDAAVSLTESGAVVGTPGYMAPEQVGSPKGITPATDVYGLGAILYELLTGRPPFRGETDLETLRQLRERDPVRPRTLNKKIDCELEVLCLKCLEKDPGRRYNSAEALADDLERWLRGESVRARRHAFAAGRLVKWVRRRPVVSILLVVWFALSAALTEVALREQQGAPDQRVSDEDLYAQSLRRVEVCLAAQNPIGAEEVLDACPRSVRGSEWRILKGLCHEPSRSAGGYRSVGVVETREETKRVSPDRLLVAEIDYHQPEEFFRNRITVWSTETGEELWSLVNQNTARWISAFTFSPDSHRIVTISHCDGGPFRNNIQIWDSRTGRALVAFGCDLPGDLPRSTGVSSAWGVRQGWFSIPRIAFSPAGDRFYVMRPDETISWSVPAEEADRTAGSPHISLTTVILVIAGGLAAIIVVWVLISSLITQAPAPQVIALTPTAAPPK
jgi:tRNA A-37 threonylcarbamoyl transferase component Bud32